MCPKMDKIGHFCKSLTVTRTELRHHSKCAEIPCLYWSHQQTIGQNCPLFPEMVILSQNRPKYFIVLYKIANITTYYTCCNSLTVSRDQQLTLLIILNSDKFICTVKVQLYHIRNTLSTVQSCSCFECDVIFQIVFYLIHNEKNTLSCQSL